MDRNNIIGFALLAILFTIWITVNNNNTEKNQILKKQQDSIAVAKQNQHIADSLKAFQLTSAKPDSAKQVLSDTAAQNIVQKPMDVTIENDLMALTVTNVGAKIKGIHLKKYKTSSEDKKGDEVRDPLYLQNAPENIQEYILPLSNGNLLKTGSLPSQVEKIENKIVVKTALPNNATLEQSYRLDEATYQIDYEVKIVGNPGLDVSKPVSIRWVDNLTRLEKNYTYERTYSTLYFKEVGESSDYISYSKDKTLKLEGKKLEWISNVNQFFNSSWIPDKPFENAELTIKQGVGEEKYLKRTEAVVSIPAEFNNGGVFKMKMYTGPNDFERLRAYNNNLDDVIQFGSSILGSINKWVIRPIFTFLGSFLSSQGLVIFLLTLFVKLALWPLTYKMIYSQSKMSSLKPKLDKLKAKYGDDSQKIQMETMALYREFGVNPLGGCLPMVLQMPIWFALYRFFPAAIEFRQAPFLWATDLSSYDVFFKFPFHVPMLGSHLSLFTVLWTVTTLLYTWYNFKKIDTTSTAANPALKYMQYIMPVFFMAFFNSFASGLTCYLVFSNIINIVQTLVTKNYLISQDKIERELENYKKKPKKKGGFSERLGEMMKEQQRVAEQRNNSKK
jgi:YidC/Oxa1 family membrane protein insertase